jgi:hypothetical protein
VHVWFSLTHSARVFAASHTLLYAGGSPGLALQLGSEGHVHVWLSLVHSASVVAAWQTALYAGGSPGLGSQRVAVQHSWHLPSQPKQQSPSTGFETG